MIILNDKNFEKEVLESDIPVIVDFYADWCGPCKAMAPIMEEISKDLGLKAKVAKINVDQNQELSINYDIMSIPTILIFNKGKLVKQLVGLRDKQEIEDIIDKF